jgi:DNA-directed RNA polymerase subunit RPC12/RpoP
MGLVDKVKSLVGEADEGPSEYECENCGHTFESGEANPNDIDCPACGSGRIHTAL